jgi:mannose-1-phosphate guanylyltransferase/mannose-6-phosphate isomerase
MIIVIIAGGSGTRLWPLSTPSYPKHLLKVNGGELSLLQNTYQRAKKLTDKIYIVSEEGHIEHVKAQLPELNDENFIIEPARRGTANCIIAALVQIAKSNDPDEVIASIHADHYIRDVAGFVHTLKTSEEAAKQYQRMVLIGVEPTYPASGFGYIQKSDIIDEGKFVFNVDGFKEKPDHDTALEYLKSGNYLWNCGYFVGSVNIFKKAMSGFANNLLDNYERLANTVNKEEFDEVYLSLQSDSIDYALIEKVSDLLVVPATFDWLDLGSYSDMHKAVGGDKNGNYVKGRVEVDEVENSFIQNHEAKPLAVIGLDNVVVINSPEGIIVARKDLSQKVGEISKRINKQ